MIIPNYSVEILLKGLVNMPTIGRSDRGLP